MGAGQLDWVLSRAGDRNTLGSGSGTSVLQGSAAPLSLNGGTGIFELHVLRFCVISWQCSFVWLQQLWLQGHMASRHDCSAYLFLDIVACGVPGIGVAFLAGIDIGGTVELRSANACDYVTELFTSLCKLVLALSCAAPQAHIYASCIWAPTLNVSSSANLFTSCAASYNRRHV